MIHKNNDAYKSIGEVAKILDLVNKKKGTLNTHTIRFWEKEFKQIKPKILNGNRRYYNNETITLSPIIDPRYRHVSWEYDSITMLNGNSEDNSFISEYNDTVKLVLDLIEISDILIRN